MPTTNHTKTVSALNPTRTELEEDIDEIRELDDVRNEAKAMLIKGLESLGKVSPVEIWNRATEGTENPRGTCKQTEAWSTPEEEPQDFLGAALAVLTAHRKSGRDICYSSNGNGQKLGCFWGKAQELLLKYRFHGLSDYYKKDKDVESLYDENGNYLPDSTAPVFEAARVLQALLCTPKTALSTATMHAYLFTMTELLVSDASQEKYIVGAARASFNTHHSAFVTAECTRAISSCAKALEYAAIFLKTFSQFLEECEELLRYCQTQHDSNIPNIALPDEWVI